MGATTELGSHPKWFVKIVVSGETPRTPHRVIACLHGGKPPEPPKWQHGILKKPPNDPSNPIEMCDPNSVVGLRWKCRISSRYCVIRTPVVLAQLILKVIRLLTFSITYMSMSTKNDTVRTKITKNYIVDKLLSCRCFLHHNDIDTRICSTDTLVKGK